MKKKLFEKFAKVFGDAKGAVCVFAPGRVNLIGEHTDYNGGCVFPCALTLGTYIVGRRTSGCRLRMYSENMASEGVTECGIDDLSPLGDRGWTSYVKGVIWAFKEQGMMLDSGLEMLVYGDIPAGSGLSSSASLEVAAGSLLRELNGYDVGNIELALLGRRAENEYVGMNCGIMDQFASAMGMEDHAICLNTSSLEYRYVPLNLKGRKIIITNTNKKHELANSAYNDRRRECERALELIGGVKSLCELTLPDMEAAKDRIGDPILLRRVRHVVTENRRTLDAVDALEMGDIKAFGMLMNESHESLRDDYEVSCRELDILADAAISINGVYGSRMTGGGFGGCTVSIVDEDAMDTFRAGVSERYRNEIGHDCTFYIVSAGGGPRIY